MRKTFLSVMFAILLSLSISACAHGVGNGITPDIPMLSSGNNAFALDLYREISREQEGDNIFFSPLSISSALGMTFNGARGATEAEMAEVLHFSLSQESLLASFESLLETLESGSLSGAVSGEPFTLTIANGLWVQDGFSLLDRFVSEVTTSYHASVENLDMAGDPEGSRDFINNWISEMTLERITDLIPSGALNADTRLVLTNAVYFKASWLHPFNEQATQRKPFNLADGSEIVVPMMNQTEHFPYVATEGCRAIELPYIDGLTGMLILLPDGDIDSFQDDFDLEKLETIQSRLVSSRIALSMPRFEFTRSVQLGRILQSMGMVSAFSSPLADFSGITGMRDLFISAVLHKAFVKVDESGTEAAAATAVIMALTSVPADPVEMTLDRSFIFLILDRNTDSIVFMGRVMNPSI